MKAPIAAFLVVFAASSFAQSNVTLYGAVDLFYQNAQGANSLSRLQSGGLSGSRFGLRGTEDLGGGLKANFVLEGGINADEGTSAQGGILYGRESHIGLSGALGSLTAGRQYSSLYAVIHENSVFTSVSAGASTALIGGFGGGYELVRGASLNAQPPLSGATGNGGPTRVNNSVKYQSPDFHGAKLSLLYGAGETAGSTGENQLAEIAARYKTRDFDVIGSYLSDEARGATNSNFTNARIASISGAYNFAPFRVVAGYVSFDDKRSANLDGKGAWLGLDYRTGKTIWKAQYVLNSHDNTSNSDSRAFGVGAVYELSPRTALYSSLTRFRNDSNTGTNGMGRFHSTIPAGLTSAQDNSVTEFVMGIRHSF